MVGDAQPARRAALAKYLSLLLMHLPHLVLLPVEVERGPPQEVVPVLRDRNVDEAVRVGRRLALDRGVGGEMRHDGYGPELAERLDLFHEVLTREDGDRAPALRPRREMFKVLRWGFDPDGLHVDVREDGEVAAPVGRSETLRGLERHYPAVVESWRGTGDQTRGDKGGWQRLDW